MAVKTNKIFCLEMVHLKDIFKKERKLYGKYSWQIHIILGKNAKYSSPKAFTIATLKLHRLNFLTSFLSSLKYVGQWAPG